eukprot:TRINITY_DN35291_c0_g1_i2.p1 TRINITY_DN35291_c0_g1~~TRINITY_DN35291_c0_g1_i2.p1  ORF type:complete len:471 (-),score=62.28 TRINITY_DN35291_c0_g1_i2:39-1451(-)
MCLRRFLSIRVPAVLSFALQASLLFLYLQASTLQKLVEQASNSALPRFIAPKRGADGEVSEWKRPIRKLEAYYVKDQALRAASSAATNDLVLNPKVRMTQWGNVSRLSADQEADVGHDKSGRSYDGMMCVNGVRSDEGQEWFSARVCSKDCTGSSIDSKVVIGQLEQPSSVANSSWRWSIGQAAKVVDFFGPNHTDKNSGPEDGRIDIVQGKRFVIATLPFDMPRKKLNLCKVHGMLKLINQDNAHGYARRPAFIPIDEFPGAEQCFIQVSNKYFEGCQTEKNWVTLIPRHSSRIYLVRALTPFQVMELDPASCTATAHGKLLKPKFTDVRSSTRYVYGVDVDAGSIFWSLAHGPPRRYASILVAILVKKSGGSFEFELLGSSCQFLLPGIDRLYDRLLSSSSSYQELRGQQFFAYPNGIVGFDPHEDVADVTYHVNDIRNIRVHLHGVRAWLIAAYRMWQDSGESFECL